MKENILDLQSNSMRDNFVFTGIPKQTPKNQWRTLIKQLKLPVETLQNITVCTESDPKITTIAHIQSLPNSKIINKKKWFRGNLSRQLKGTNDGLNEQCPKLHSWALKTAFPNPKTNDKWRKKGNHHHCGQIIHKWRVISWLGHYPLTFLNSSPPFWSQ